MTREQQTEDKAADRAHEPRNVKEGKGEQDPSDHASAGQGLSG